MGPLKIWDFLFLFQEYDPNMNIIQLYEGLYYSLTLKKQKRDFKSSLTLKNLAP